MKKSKSSSIVKKDNINIFKKPTYIHKIISGYAMSITTDKKNYCKQPRIKEILWTKFIRRNNVIFKNRSKGEFAYKGKNFKTYSELPRAKSALITFTSWQKLFILNLILFLVLSLYFNLLLTATIVVAFLSIIYFLDLLFSTYLIYRSLHSSPELDFSQKQINKLKNKDLPIYTILCPLYKESLILPEFVKAIKNIDWPKNKLEVLLLLEEDDQETIKKAKKLKLNKTFKIVVVPNSKPKTKPKACNYGLNRANGEFVVIYDAEDRPEIDQLKKAYLGFKSLSKKVVCIQSKLNYYNSGHNLLTKLFTAEYSLWFDLILPGLQSMDTIIPLGGTSNHFRTRELKRLKGWDAFNVTEDCDLGVRLYVKGLKTATMNSTTYEEANSKFLNWIRQRSRWIKGYLQTYLVHMRNPLKLYKNLGTHFFLFQLIIGLRMVFILVNPMLWLLTISYFVLFEFIGESVQAIYPAPILYIAVTSLVLGNFLYLYNHMIALGKRQKWHLVKFVFAIPFYWLMASIASIVSFYQLVVKPHYWEKTVHGFHLGRQSTKVSLPSIAIPSVKIPSIKVSFALPVVFSKDRAKLILKVFSIIGSVGLIALNYEYFYSLRNIHLAVPLFISALALTWYQHMQKQYRGAILGYSAAIFGTVSYEHFGAVHSNTIFILYYSLTFFLTAVLLIKRRIIFDTLNSLIHHTKDSKYSNKENNQYNILIYNWRDIYHKSAGGAEVYVHELATRWAKEGNHVTVFCGNDGRSKRHEYVDNVEIYRKGSFYTVYLWAFIYYIFRFRSKYHVVIDSSNAIPFFTPIFSRAIKILVIHHLHEQEIKRQFKRPLSSIACFIESKVTPFLYKNISVVTVSTSSRKDLIRLGFKKNNINIVTPCVDQTEIDTMKKSKYPHFIYLGRLRYYKNIDIAIKAFKTIADKFPNSKLTIAGDGEAMAELKALVKNLKIKKNVDFTGYVSENKKSKLLTQAWISLQPSSYEGWGITVLEANSHFTPVISADVKGLRDSVINGKTGLLVKEINSEQFAKAMSKLILNKKLLSKLSKNAKKWSEYFDWDKNAHVFMRIIENEIAEDRLVAENSPVYETIKEYKL